MSFEIKPNSLLNDTLKLKGLILMFTPVAQIESIWILLALACHLKFKLYQPKGFVDPHYPNHVLYLKKAMYSLK